MNREGTTLDLTAASGLPMRLGLDGRLTFDPQVVVQEYRARTFTELAPVYLDSQACQSQRTAYEMFNGVFHEQDRERLSGLAVRYELTLFPALKIGQEYVKTLGHIHRPETRSEIDPPEICEVVAGQAHFLFTKLNPASLTADEAFYVEVCAGEKIIIPPGYDHLTINPGPGPLLFSDVVSSNVSGNYERIKAAGGAVYLEVEENGLPVFIPNPRYRDHPPLRRMRPKEQPDLCLTKQEPLYVTFVKSRAQDWEFLWRPELFQDKFTTVDNLFSVL